MNTPLPATSDLPVRIEPWPSEVPLFLLCLLTSLGIWALAFISIIGIVYGVMLGLFFFVMHLALVAHVRGNGVRLGPEQLPVADLYERFGAAHPNREELRDPYDGDRYGYRQRGNQFIVYSIGPDGEYRTKDDLVYQSTRLMIPAVTQP